MRSRARAAAVRAALRSRCADGTASWARANRRVSRERDPIVRVVLLD